MLRCPKCNAELQDDARFCHVCGSKMEVPAPTPRCPKCNTDVDASARFCHVCGANMAAPAPEPVVAEEEVAPAVVIPVPEQPVLEEVPEEPTIVEDEVPVAEEAPQEEVPVVEEVSPEVPETEVEESAESAEEISVAPVAVPKVPAVAQTEEISPVAPPETTPKKKRNMPLLIGGAAGILAVFLMVAIIIISVTLGGNKVQNYGLYVKDNEMFYTGVSRIKPWQVTEELSEDDLQGQSSVASVLSAYTHVTEDGNTIFFVDRISDDGFGLYYRKVNKSKSDPVKLDNDVISYAVSENGKIVTYLTREGTLYRHNLEEKDKIASDVDSFYVSDNGKKVMFITEEGDLYFQTKGKDKEKMVSEISTFFHVNEDFDTAYYIKDDALYRQKVGKDREKMVSELDRVIRVTEEGNVYYVRTENSSKSLMDYVDDDLASADAAMREPVSPTAPDYPSYFDYSTYEEYQAAYNKYQEEYEKYQDARTKYWEDLDAYSQKESRDDLRENLRNRTYSYDTYILCYYDGEEKVLCENFLFSGYILASDADAMIYSDAAAQGEGKVKLSEIKYTSDVEDFLRENQTDGGTYYFVRDGIVTELESDIDGSYTMTSDGKTAFFMKDVEDGEGSLYRVEISGSKVKDPELYDEEVSSLFLRTRGDTVLYFKDVKDDGRGDLYCNKELVDYDVSQVSVFDEDTFFYYVDVNSDKEYGTLKLYRKGKTVKVSDDVHDADFTPKGEILYLSDYNTDRYRGDLYLFNGKKSKKVDEDVVCIIPVVNRKMYGRNAFLTY